MGEMTRTFLSMLTALALIVSPTMASAQNVKQWAKIGPWYINQTSSGDCELFASYSMGWSITMIYPATGEITLVLIGRHGYKIGESVTVMIDLGVSHFPKASMQAVQGDNDDQGLATQLSAQDLDLLANATKFGVVKPDRSWLVSLNLVDNKAGIAELKRCHAAARK